ncbi:MAG: hypothetical protein CVT73_16270 [Alphaproteobacteria bacterium HGW-Alphaproteobacteria-12]|nr:MAG: hypothetical protein CVT73_16270 [Alphaproteobacteria bacterium HGW-Alphaproteobacteria-12]
MALPGLPSRHAHPATRHSCKRDLRRYDARTGTPARQERPETRYRGVIELAIRYCATRVLAVCALLAAICAEASPLAAASKPIEISTSTLLWNPEDRTESRTGKLVWAGGIEITSPDEDFGGWSGLAVSPDGAAMLSVSDKGHWLTAILLYDERGRLSGMAEAKIAPMLGLDGKPIAGKTLGDAESLVILPVRTAVLTALFITGIISLA